MMFCDPVYEAWMDEAVALGRIAAPGYFDDPVIRRAYLGSEWRGDAMGHIDPVKSATAAEKRLQLTLTTHEQEAAELTGADWSDVIERRGREEQSKRASGIAPVVAPAAPADDLDTASPDEDSDEEVS
jgi:capsid protein